MSENIIQVPPSLVINKYMPIMTIRKPQYLFKAEDIFIIPNIQPAQPPFVRLYNEKWVGNDYQFTVSLQMLVQTLFDYANAGTFPMLVFQNGECNFSNGEDTLVLAPNQGTGVLGVSGGGNLVTVALNHDYIKTLIGLLDPTYNWGVEFVVTQMHSGSYYYKVTKPYYPFKYTVNTLGGDASKSYITLDTPTFVDIDIIELMYKPDNILAPDATTPLYLLHKNTN